MTRPASASRARKHPTAASDGPRMATSMAGPAPSRRRRTGRNEPLLRGHPRGLRRHPLGTEPLWRLHQTRDVRILSVPRFEDHLA
jgi:hypothetical protein